MEPIKAQIEPASARIIYTIYTRAKRVEERNGSWWVQFDGSWESLHFGEYIPFEQGDLVKITFERVIQNA